MGRTLILVGGISDHAYMKEAIQKTNLWGNLCELYTDIIEIDYQKVMDRHALLFKSLLDPVRLLMSPDGWAAERYMNKVLTEVISHKVKVDLMSHSQGSWMTMKMPIKVENYFCVANPIGFKGFIGRKTVQMNISVPKIISKRHYMVYSNNDLISCDIPFNKKLWGTGKIVEYLETGTKHDMVEYADWLNRKALYLFL